MEWSRVGRPATPARPETGLAVYGLTTCRKDLKRLLDRTRITLSAVDLSLIHI